MEIISGWVVLRSCLFFARIDLRLVLAELVEVRKLEVEVFGLRLTTPKPVVNNSAICWQRSRKSFVIPQNTFEVTWKMRGNNR